MNSLIPSAPGETGAASALDPAGSLGLGAAKAALGVASPNARRGPGDAEDDAAAPVPPAPNFAQWLAAGAAGAAAPLRASGFRAPQAKRLPARAEQDTGLAANRPDSAENGASAAPESPAPLSAAADRPAPARKSALAAASPAVPAGVVAMPPANVPFAPGLPTAGFAPAAPASPSDSLAEHGRQGGGPGRADALAEAGRQDASASAPQAGPKAGAALSPRALTYSGGSRTQLSAPPPGTERPQVPPANLEPPANPAGPDAGPPGAAKSGAFPIAMGSLPASVPVHAGGGEKIAAGIQIQPANGSADQSPRDKNSLSHNDKEDTSQLSGLGMGGAKTVPTMSAPAFAHAHPGEIAPTSGLPMTAGPAAAAAPGAAPS